MGRVSRYIKHVDRKIWDFEDLLDDLLINDIVKSTCPIELVHYYYYFYSLRIFHISVSYIIIIIIIIIIIAPFPKFSRQF